MSFDSKTSIWSSLGFALLALGYLPYSEAGGLKAVNNRVEVRRSHQSGLSLTQLSVKPKPLPDSTHGWGSPAYDYSKPGVARAIQVPRLLTHFDNGFGAASPIQDLAAAIETPEGRTVVERHLMQLSSQARDSAGGRAFAQVKAAEGPLDLHLLTKESPYLLKVPKQNPDLTPENRAKTPVASITTDQDLARMVRELTHGLPRDKAPKPPEAHEGHPHHPDSPTPTPTVSP
jgi:hypothetical protein